MNDNEKLTTSFKSIAEILRELGNLIKLDKDTRPKITIIFNLLNKERFLIEKAITKHNYLSVFQIIDNKCLNWENNNFRNIICLLILSNGVEENLRMQFIHFNQEQLVGAFQSSSFIERSKPFEIFKDYYYSCVHSTEYLADSKLTLMIPYFLCQLVEEESLSNEDIDRYVSFKNSFFKQEERISDNKEYVLKFLSENLDNLELKNEVIKIKNLRYTYTDDN